MAQNVDVEHGLQMSPRSDSPDRRVDVLLLLVATFGAAAIYVGTLLLEVHPPRGLIVAFFVAPPICAMFAIFILSSRARADRDPRLAWVSAGVAVGVVAMVLQLVSFPVVAPDGGLFGTSDRSSAALYLLFHLAFAAGVAAGAFGVPVRWRLPVVVVGWAFALLLATDLIPLPKLIHAGTEYTPLLIAEEVVLATLTAAATAVWVLRVGRSTAPLHGWIGVALSLSVYDVLLNAIGAERFDPVWWGSLSLRVGTYLVLAFGALSAVLARLRDAESYSAAELDRRESQLRDSLAVTSGLLASAEAFSRAVTSTQVADVLSANARAVAGATYASILVGQGDESLRLLGADGYDAAMRARLMETHWDLDLPAPQVFALGEPLFIDTQGEVRQRFPGIADLPMGRAASLAALPIKVGGEPIGVLSVWDLRAREWSRNQRRVLAGLAAQGGQAIARAQAYEEQAAAARTLQRALLPARLPRPKRLDVAARYVAAVDGVQVGGDWYDCLVLGDERVALVVGDVMGKGLHAAAQMGQIRMAVRSLAALDPAPWAVLTALDGLNIELGVDEIVTIVYVLVDTDLGVARIARAGHLPPALVRPDGSVEYLEGGGSAPLGAPAVRRVETEIELPVGGALVIYTDGLVEDRATGLDRGMDQLLDALAEVATSASAGDIATQVLERCASGRGEDDIALLVARYTA
ncbi:MAG: PP2C family protein-serine/threonine phosphatase [Nocardioides sp.]